MKAELIFYNGAKLLEGPCWDGRKGRLYFVAIRQNTIFCLEPETGRVYSYSTEGAVGAAVADEGFTLLEAEKSGIYRLDLATGKKQPFAHVFSDPVMRYNDGKLDPKGRFLVDVMGDQERNSRGGLFAVERDGSFRQLIGGTTVANGLGFSPNGETLYFIDTPTKKVMAYAYSAESGTLLSEGQSNCRAYGGWITGRDVRRRRRAALGSGIRRRESRMLEPGKWTKGGRSPSSLPECHLLLHWRRTGRYLVYHDGPMSRGGECPLGGRTIPSEDLLIFKDLIRRPPVSGPDFFGFSVSPLAVLSRRRTDDAGERPTKCAGIGKTHLFR